MNLFFSSLSAQNEQNIQDTNLIAIKDVSKYINSSEFLYYVLRRKNKNKLDNFKILPEIMNLTNKQPKNNLAIAKYVCKEENKAFNYFAKKNFENPILIKKEIKTRIKQVNLFRYVFSPAGSFNNDLDFEEYLENVRIFGQNHKINLSIMSFKFKGTSYLFTYQLTDEEVKLLSNYSFLFQNPLFSSELVGKFINSIQKDDVLKIFRPDGKEIDLNVLRNRYVSKIFYYLYNNFY